MSTRVPRIASCSSAGRRCCRSRNSRPCTIRFIRFRFSLLPTTSGPYGSRFICNAPATTASPTRTPAERRAATRAMPFAAATTIPARRPFPMSEPISPRPSLTLPIKTRGVFGRHSYVRMAEIADGTSNTIALGERQRPRKIFDKGSVAVDATANPANYVPLSCRASVQRPKIQPQRPRCSPPTTRRATAGPRAMPTSPPWPRSCRLTPPSASSATPARSRLTCFPAFGRRPASIPAAFRLPWPTAACGSSTTISTAATSPPSPQLRLRRRQPLRRLGRAGQQKRRRCVGDF